MRTFFVGCFLLLLGVFSSTVHAGFSCQPPPFFWWTGFYVGVQGGYGTAFCKTRIEPLPSAEAFVNLAPIKLHPHPSGGFAGGQIGYNFQCQKCVFGLEADFSGSDFRGSKTTTPIIQNDGTPFRGGGSIFVKQRTDWFGTLRPRIGYALTHNLLFYATAGLAYAHTHYKANTDFQPDGTEQYPVSFSKVRTGWSVGGGVEYGICPHWSLKADYLYYDLGHFSKVANPLPPLPPFQILYKFETFNHLLRLGLNYSFGC